MQKRIRITDVNEHSGWEFSDELVVGEVENLNVRQPENRIGECAGEILAGEVNGSDGSEINVVVT